MEVRRPLTTTLGLSICGESTSGTEGTGGFYIAELEGGDSKRMIFLITARHVVFPPNIVDENMYEHENPSQSRRNVLLLGDGAFKKLLASLRWEIGNAANNVQCQEKRLIAVEGMEEEEEEEEEERGSAKMFRLHW